jgi:4-hydroxybenzoate polyprenyltransferase
MLAAVRLIRPHQWLKNFLVFVPVLTSRSFFDIPGILSTLLMFASLCATASSIYVVNDLLDREADRLHPRKKLRPLASGEISVPTAIVLAAALLSIGIGLAHLAGGVAVVAGYAIIAVLYSLGLKTFPLVDVFMLAGLYTMRIIAGGVASQHPVTLWLLGFSYFTFLSLAFVKRCGELVETNADANAKASARRGYSVNDRHMLEMFGCASAFASSVVLALFVSSEAAERQYQAPEVLWLLVPLFLFWQCRLWLATGRGYMHDDPILYALKDWVSWATVGSAVMIMFVASLISTLSIVAPTQ